MPPHDQVRIIQAGSEIFAFDTIRWPGEIFQYPIVYIAEAMNEDSYDAQKVGWKWMTRKQFEWVLRHYSCMISYLGAVGDGETFYCNNHCCWEKDGKDYSATQVEISIENYWFESDLDEERKV